MTKQAGINAPIYKIDVDAVREYFDSEIELSKIPQKLVDEYNKQKQTEVYESQGQTSIDGSYTQLFLNITSQANTSSWVRYFDDTSISLRKITNQLQHLVCFVIVKDELFAYTAGQSAVVFERFVDMSFPIEVGRRIAKPEVKGARANQITGMTLASDLHFRDPRRITYTESLDTVWSSLSGYLRDTLLGNEKLNDVFGSKSKIKIDVTAALRLGPKIHDPKRMVILIEWFIRQREKELPADDGWSALDAIKILSPRKKRNLIDELKKDLSVQIFKNHKYENLALAHAESGLYGGATTYIVRSNKSEIIYTDSHEPTLAQIISNVEIDPDYIKNFTSIEIETKNDDYGDSYGTSGTLLAHLNGELTHAGRTYFLLSGKWYEVDADYIESIKKDFLALITELDINAKVIGLKPWEDSKHEGIYNANSLEYEEHINGDTVLTDNIELFDTLAFKGNELYIVHVKKGFNVKIRDVRSQIMSSAQIIENDLRGERRKLKMHYAQLAEKQKTTLSEAEFLNLFKRKRVYVLAYGRKDKITEVNIKKVTSSVAKMEIVSLNNQFRQITPDDRATLRIMWIPLIGT